MSSSPGSALCSVKAALFESDGQGESLQTLTLLSSISQSISSFSHSRFGTFSLHELSIFFSRKGHFSLVIVF